MKPAFDGLLVVDKPGGVTSRDVVNRAQRWFPRGTRLGHTGTLDPLATGVLVLCVGTATRLAEYVQRMDKTYEARLRLGARSDTDDADGIVEPVAVSRPPEVDAVRQALRHFVGDVRQVPPTFSATKVGGQRCYDLARRGRAAELKPRPVRIYGIDLRAYDYPRLDIDVRCGKGTYIRALARDLGEHLGCGALVERLRRTRVGPFTAEAGMAPDLDAAAARARLLPVAQAVSELPRIALGAREVARLRQGQLVPLQEVAPPVGDEAAIFDEAQALVGVARIDRERGLLRPLKVLASP
jgi:tRNA pseudouridine55 synthase